MSSKKETKSTGRKWAGEKSGKDLADCKEGLRLAALYALNMLDTEPEAEFDALTDLAAAICGARMAAVTLVDRDRLWFKSRHNLSAAEAERAGALCSAVVENRAALLVDDASCDARFRDSPLVTASPHVRGYAGIPLSTPEGHCIGTLCVMHNAPLTLDEAALDRLRAIARIAEERVADRHRQAATGTANEVLAAIARVQSEFISGDVSERAAFDDLLSTVLRLTGSEYGFIGEVLEDETGPYLRTWAITNIAWNDETRDFYDLRAPDGLEFRNLDSLFGHSLRTGEALLTNAPGEHPAAAGLPEGHPPLNAYAGIPLHSHGEFVAMLGLANRRGGYSETVLEECAPLLQTIGDLIHARRVSGARDDALKRLAASEHRFNLAINGIAAGIWELDLVAGTLFTSDRLLEILGRAPSPDDSRGTYASDGLQLLLSRVHPDDREKVEAGLQRTWQTREPYEMTYRFQHADGEYLHLFVRGQAEWDETGRAVRMAGSAEDITDRMRLVEIEERTRARLAAVTELGGFGSWEVDLATGEGEWDETTRSIVEVDEDFRPSLAAVMRFTPPEFRKHAQDAFRRSVETGETWDIELPLNTAKGRRIWARIIGKPLIENGRAVRLIGSFQDISERKLREEELETLSNRLTMALDSSGVGVWEFNLERGEFWWDEACVRMFGRDGDDGEMSFRNWKRCVHPEDLPDVMAQIDLAISTERPCRFEYRIILPGGEVRYIRVHALLKRRVDGTRVVGGTNFDITNDVLTAQELDRRRAEAEAANAAKSRFLANMSHEIRTPLNGVLGMAQLLKMTSLDGKQAQFVETLQSSGRALLDLIEDVLDISKIESGMVEIASAPFELAAVVRSTIDVVEPTAREKGLEIDTRIDPEIPAMLLGDEKRMRQVLINIVGNAVKFTDEGRVSVDVRQGEGDTVHFEVRDSGPGIPSDRLDQVFDRFAQVDESATRKHGGTGLGLAICREIVELAGGRIGVSSVHGEGACFWFDVPLPAALAAPDADMPDTRAKGPGMAVRGRVLVVDDVETNRVVAAALVRNAGHEVDIASNGMEAIAALEIGQYDVVLMDIQMPVMSGAETIAHIRASGTPWADLPIFAVTADAICGARDRYLAIGATGYLSKPLDMDAVEAALNSVFRQARRA